MKLFFYKSTSLFHSLRSWCDHHLPRPRLHQGHPGAPGGRAAVRDGGQHARHGVRDGGVLRRVPPRARERLPGPAPPGPGGGEHRRGRWRPHRQSVVAINDCRE